MPTTDEPYNTTIPDPEKNYLQVSVRVPKDDAEKVTDFFMASQAIGYHELLYQEGVTRNLAVDDTVLNFFFEPEFPLQAFMPMALAGLDLEQCPYHITRVDTKDYLKAFEQTFDAFALTRKTVLVPPWSLDTYNEKYPGCTAVLLTPGLAFGTGKHATSKLMVAFLEAAIGTDSDLLDLGTGSGILALAGAVFGAPKVTGVDVERLAIESAIENFDSNKEFHNLTTAARFSVADFEIIKNYDFTENTVFVANILADVFFKNEQLLKLALEQSSTWALSGIVEEALPRFEPWLHNLVSGQKVHIAESEGWYCLSSIPIQL